MKLLIFTMLLSLIAMARNDASDYITALKAREVEGAILDSSKYDECYGQHQALETTNISQFNSAMETCIKDTIDTASKEELENVARSMSINQVKFERTKTNDSLRQYLTERIHDAIHGQGSYGKKKMKEMKFVDQRIFFTLYESQIHKNITIEFAKYCLENIGVKTSGDREQATNFLNFLTNADFGDKFNNGEAKFSDITGIKYFNVANRDGAKASTDKDKYTKNQTVFDDPTASSSFTAVTSGFKLNDHLREYKYCPKTNYSATNDDPNDPCHEKNARNSGLVNHLKEFELMLGKIPNGDGKIGVSLGNRFIICSKFIVPAMCEAFRCRNTYDWANNSPSDDTFMGKKLKYCQDDLGISAADTSNKEGKIACNVVDKIVDYKKTLEMIKKQKEDLNNNFKVNSGFDVGVAFKGKYRAGQGSGEKGIDEITSIASKELSSKVGQLAGNAEQAEKLRQDCLVDDGSGNTTLNATDANCQNLEVDVDSLKKATFQAQAETVAYLRRVREFQQNGGTEEDLKNFLIENGVATSANVDEMITNMTEEELLSIVENKYKADRQAIIANMNDKLYAIRNKKKDDSIKTDIAEDQINELEDSKERVETLFNYTNIVSSYVQLKNEEGEGRGNNMAREIEEKGYSEYASDQRQEYEEFFDDNEGESNSGSDQASFYSTESLINDIGDFAAAE